MPRRIASRLRRGYRRARPRVVAICVIVAAVGVVLPFDLVLPLLDPGRTWAAEMVTGLAPSPAEKPPGRAPSAEDLHAILVRQNHAFRLARRLRDELPRESFEPAAVVSRAGRDPDSLLRWVRERTSWLPYQGALRGSSGVLQERRGSSLDRALLLADLLSAAGHEARIARAELAAAAAKRIAAELLALPDAPPPVTGGEYISKELEEAIQTRIAGKAEAGWNPSELVARHEELSEDIVGRGVVQARILSRLLGYGGQDEEDRPAGVGDDGERPEALAPDDVPPDAVAAARDHFWVQVRIGDAWRDLDPEDAVLAATGGTPAPAVVFPPDEVPEELVHRVTLRATIERWDGAGLEEAVPLEHTFRVRDHVGERISFSVQPLSAAREGKEDERAELLRIAETNDEWLPLLRAGRKSHRQASFYGDGTLNPNPSEIASHRKLTAASRRLGALGSDKKPGQLTALWLDYRVDRPGADPVSVRREIFDLLGPARRAKGEAPRPVDAARRRERGLALLGETEILLAGGRVSPAALRYWLLDGLIESRGALLRFLHASDAEDREEAERAVSEVRLRPVGLLHLAILRDQLSSVSEHTYLGEPNIFSTHLLGRDIAGEARLRMGVDIVRNPVSVRPGAPVDPRSVRLRQGVLDTVAEATLVPGRRGENAATLFAAAQARGESWEVLRGPDDLGRLEESVPADARARMAAALAAGKVLVAARGAPVATGTPAYAWWQVDPETGAALGISSNGWGGFVEDLLTRLKDFITAVATKEFGIWLMCEFLGMIIGGLVASIFLGADPHSAEMISFIVGALISGVCKKIASRLGAWLDSMRPPAREPLMLTDDATRYLTHDEQAQTLTELLSKVAREYPEAVGVPR